MDRTSMLQAIDGWRGHFGGGIKSRSATSCHLRRKVRYVKRVLVLRSNCRLLLYMPY
jgi:hypothetical protein